jgi:S1-C subfamily serine protease
VNIFDVVMVLGATAAAIGGWRFGFIARVLAWAGVAVGLMLGVRFVPAVVTKFGGTAADDRVTVALLFLLLVATIGEGVGLGIGVLVQRLRYDERGLQVWDRAAGAAVGVLGIFVLAWMAVPSLAVAEGWPARWSRGSALVHAMTRIAPEQPERFTAWGLAVADAPYPNVVDPLEDGSDLRAPSSVAIPPVVEQQVRRSVVKVSGRACDEQQQGSGWVARPGLVVTNAHVIAGEQHTDVYDVDGQRHDAMVIAFDARNDLAVLHVPGFDEPALPLVDAKNGDLVAVYGHPHGAALRVAPAQIGYEGDALVSDIYRDRNHRLPVYVLGARLQVGDSGAPLVTVRGGVAGVAFAIDAEHDERAYALTKTQVEQVLETLRGERLDRPDLKRDCLP